MSIERELFKGKSAQTGLHVFKHRWMQGGRSHFDDLVVNAIHLDHDKALGKAHLPAEMSPDERKQRIDRYGYRMVEAIELGIDPVALGTYVKATIAWLDALNQSAVDKR